MTICGPSVASRRRADLTFASFLAIGFGLTVVVGLLTGGVLLALAVGLTPGVVLGGIAWFRIRRGGCGGCQFCPVRTMDKCGQLAE